MTDPRTLRQLQDEVRKLAAKLVDTTRGKVMRDVGPATDHEKQALLEQLREAVATGTESGRGGRRGTPSPISESALDMLTQIEVEAADMHVKALVHDGVAAEDRIRALVALAGRWTDPTAVAGVRRFLQQWVDEITGLLDPPRRMELTPACPACDALTVLREEAGEEVRVHALQVDGQDGCRCLACGHHWPTTHLYLLAGAIGCPPVSDLGDTPAA